MRAIDADFIIQKLTDFGAKKAELDRDLYLLGGVIAIVDNAPTIEPVKRGKWVQKYPDKPNAYFCSECGFPDDSWKCIRSKYCSHCGAKMGGTE